MTSSLLRSLMEADDALYNHESAFYRYCATGFPMSFADKNFEEQFEAKRQALTAKLEFLQAARAIEKHYTKVPCELTVLS